MRELRVLIATDRPAVRTFFLSLQHHAAHAIAVDWVPLASDLPAAAPPAAAIAVLDVGSDPIAVIQLCQRVRHHRPELPLLGLLCCPHAVTPWQLQALLAAGIDSLVDLHTPASTVLHILYTVACGDIVLRARVNGDHAPWRDVHSTSGVRQGGSRPAHPRGGAQIELLALIAQGLSDSEIGQQLCQSPYTVKHHVERLRDEMGVRNRLELAAWAGKHGLYRPTTDVAGVSEGYDSRPLEPVVPSE